MKAPDATRASLHYQPDLDGLRAISCLLVFCYHVSTSKAWAGQMVWLRYLQGWIGVYVFFVLSGFLITSLLIADEAVRGRIRYVAFFLRREFRIVPAYYATILIYGLICLTPVGQQYAAQYRAGFWYWVAYSGDLATSLPSVGTLLGHSWSLAIEQRFYLVWPFLLFALFRSWSLRLAVYALTLIAVLILPLSIMNSYLALILGAGVAILRSYGVGLAFLRKTPVALSAGLAMTAFALTYWRWTYLSAFCAAMALFIWHLSAGESWLKRLLGIKPLAWIGQRSYSFYLLHVICLNAALRAIHSQFLAGAIAAFSLALLITLGASALSFRFIEEPCRKFGKRFTVSSGKQTRLTLVSDNGPAPAPTATLPK